MVEHSQDEALSLERPDVQASDAIAPDPQSPVASKGARIWFGLLGLAALFVLFFGLGSRGLWDPWEMNEADLARSLTVPGEVYANLSPSVDAPTHEQLKAQAQDVGLNWIQVEAGQAGQLQATLDAVRVRPIAALVVDETVLLPNGQSASQLASAAQRLDDMRAAVGQGYLLIVSPREQAELDSLHSQLSEQLTKLEVVRGPDVRWELLSLNPPERLKERLQDAQSLLSKRAGFKVNGELFVRPPLESWLVAISYSLFGANEFSSRFPGAFMGLLTLALVVFVSSRVYGWRVGVLSGAVLLSLPLFYSQTRLMMGSSALMLAFSAVGGALLLRSAGRKCPVTFWGLLSFGLIWGFLADGVFALLLMGLLALTVPLTAGARRLKEWTPALVLLGAALLGELLAQGAPSDSWLAGLRFETPMFGQGHDLYHRTLDLVIRALGFGLAPWSPIVVIALAVLTFGALQRREMSGVVLAAWFFIATAGVMAGLKTGNHYLFIGVGGAAIAVALMLAEIASGKAQARAPQYFIAAALVMMFYILRRELKPSPEPLIGFLAFDPPFASEGPMRFPESLTFDPVYKSLFILAALICLLYFGKAGRAGLKALGFVRKHALVLTSVAAFLGAMVTLYGVSRVHNTSMGSAYSDTIRGIQRALPERLAHPSDPVMSALFGFLLVLLVALVLKTLGSKARWEALRERIATGLMTPQRQRWVLASAVGALLTAVGVGFQVKLPTDSYLMELLFTPTSLVGGLVLVGLLLGLRKLSSSWREIGLTIFSVLALAVAAQLSRDASLKSGLVGVLGLMTGALLTLSQAPRVFVSWSRTLTVVFGVLTIVALGYCLILADRGLWVVEVVYAGDIQSGAEPASLIRRGAFLVVPVIVLLGLALRFGPAWLARLTKQRLTESTLHRWGETLVGWSEHRLLMLATLALLAVWGTGSYVLKLEPAVAAHVSQKHILDHWLELESHTENLFKHGAFGTSERKDVNFYTAALPELRGRDEALRVLVGEQDQILDVHTPYGVQTKVLSGFSASNDANKDGKRDRLARSGFVTSVAPNRIEDSTASFEPNALVGYRVGDHTGRSFRITANDSTSITFEGGARSEFALVPRAHAYYTIDDGTLDQRATAETRVRRGVLLPTSNLSELNHAYRQLTKGKHLPILEANSRVMLASSFLNEGEAQQNPLALATYTEQSFADLKDARVQRVWGTFEDTLQVVGYRTDVDSVRPGQRLELTVYYKVLKPVRKNLKIFVHLDKAGGNGRIPGDHWPLNPTRHSEENKNCTGCYRTDHWMVGDIVADTYAIDIPESATGAYTIWVGLFVPGPDTRMTVTKTQTGRTQHDGTNRLGLGQVRIR